MAELTGWEYVKGWGDLEGQAFLVEVKDETLADVMWEIAEERERADLIDARCLRRQIEARLARMDEIKPDFFGQRTAAGNAYLHVLQMIDELQERED